MTYSVLHILPAFMPAREWGGPVFSTEAICRYMGSDPGFDIRVLTTDTASPVTRTRLDVPSGWVESPAGYRVRYARKTAMDSVSTEMFATLPSAIRSADLVHLSFTYSFPTLPTLALCRCFNKPLVWSPRGGMHATEIWKEVRRRKIKTVFEGVAARLIPDNAVLHVTSEEERWASQKRLPGVDAVVIPNSVDVPEVLPEREWRPDGLLRLLFLSRLHQKKGLDRLIEALAILPSYVTLDVVGSGNPEYEASLRTRIVELGVKDRVQFHGHLDGEDKALAFYGADLFVLPTRSENFGIAVAEALAHGVPAITTYAAPWKGMEEHGCGRWIEQGVEPTATAIREIENRDLKTMGLRGHRWMRTEFSLKGVGARMAELYLGMIRRF